MPKYSTANFLTNISEATAADSGFRTHDPKIVMSNSPTRYRYASAADDITGRFSYIKRRYIQLASSN